MPATMILNGDIAGLAAEPMPATVSARRARAAAATCLLRMTQGGVEEREGFCLSDISRIPRGRPSLFTGLISVATKLECDEPVTEQASRQVFSGLSALCVGVRPFLK